MAAYVDGGKLLRVYGSRFRVRAFFMALVVVSIPWIGSMICREYNLGVFNQGDDDQQSVELMTDDSIELEIFRNLTNEGVLGLQDKGLIVTNDEEDEKLVDYYPSIDFVPYLDLERKNVGLDHDYDFVLTHESVESVDKFLKLDGVMVVKKKGTIKDHESFRKPSNYKTLFLKHLDSPTTTTTEAITIIAMKKTRTVGDHDDKNKDEGSSNTNIPHRRLMFEQKKAEAIKNLESVVLEPPRAPSWRSSVYLKKPVYLPDLMDDSFLEEYPRRVFIDVNGDSTVWFTKNYPTKNKKFEIYRVETTGTKEVEGEVEGALMETEITDWLRQNVKKDEYVVMKGEAEVVEELIRSKTIGLVDELFLECKYQGVKCQKCRRPYWKCLALYGLLKDAGVAVHQWWG